MADNTLPLKEELLNEEQAAKFLKFSVKTLQAWRFRGGGPKFVKISRRAVRYRFSDLTDWVASNIKSSTSASEGS